MQNRMRETVDNGLAAIQANAGQNGWPALPQSALGPGTSAPFAAIAPPPDPNAAAEIADQVQAADRAEQEAAAGSGPNPVASYGLDGSCALPASQAMALMENPPNAAWKSSLATPLNQIRSLGLIGYAAQNGGVANLRAKTRQDLATLMSNGGRDVYGMSLNQAWINLLDCMSRSGVQ
jgi:hypothetical protein